MTTVPEAFQAYKQRLEITSTDEADASRRQKDVRATVQARFAVDDDFLTGSYRRETKTKPLQDVDIFVVLGAAEKARLSARPADVLRDLEACLVERYGRSQVEPDRRCVTVWFEKRNPSQDQDGKVLSLDVVPAFAVGNDFEIPDKSLRTWIRTNPKIHNEKSTAKNKELGGSWVPLVKMLKGWNRNSGKPIRPSFLVEVMALDLVDGPFKGYPDETRRFFAAAAATIGDDWPDPAGLGPLVSDEMSPTLCDNACDKLEAAEVIAARAFRAEQQGRQGEALGLWKQVFGQYFPSA